jgi:hypothetical protein
MPSWSVQFCFGGSEMGRPSVEFDAFVRAFLKTLSGPGRMLELAMLIELMFGSAAAIAAEPMSPAEIRATFFNGQPFTAISPSGAKFKMTFTPDGKISREALEQAGTKSLGTWKINAKGFCTAWNRAASNCFTVVPSGENKWSVQKIATTIATTVAVWSK